MKNSNCEILLLQIRNLIAEREMITAQANLDLSRGGWLRDYADDSRMLDREIQKLFRQTKRKDHEREDDVSHI